MGRVFGSLLLLVIAHWATAAGAQVTISGTVSLFDDSGERVPGAQQFVVFVEGADSATQAALADSSVPDTHPRISHQGLMFSPRVMPVTVGTTIDFLNDDRIFHNAFSVSRAKEFDLGIYPEGTSKLVTFGEPGLVRVYCNIHPDMVSNILVLSNAYFAVTDEAGTFSIEGLPEGELILRVWSEFAEETRETVTAGAGEAISREFRVIASTQFLPHLNKFGMPYRTRY